MLRMSETEYAAFLLRTGQGARIRSMTERQRQTNAARLPDKDDDADDKPKRNRKYKNEKVFVYADGFISNIPAVDHGELTEVFDSSKEHRRCQELRLLQKCGVISDLKTQDVLVIQPAFTAADGEKYRAITYRADFTYTQDGKQVVEDVKGYDEKHGKYLTTEAFNLKWKLLKAKYPDKIFKLY